MSIPPAGEDNQLGRQRLIHWLCGQVNKLGPITRRERVGDATRPHAENS